MGLDLLLLVVPGLYLAVVGGLFSLVVVYEGRGGTGFDTSASDVVRLSGDVATYLVGVPLLPPAGVAGPGDQLALACREC